MKTMKKVVAFMLAVVMSMSLMACGSKGVSLEDVKKAGKLTIATSPDFPPFEYLEGEEIVGIEIEIMEKVAEELGVELEIKDMAFDSILQAVQAGKYNVGVSGITITPERQKNADFTTPYFMASQAIVVMADSDIKTKADLDGKKISVQTGTTAEDYCMKEGYNVNAFEANNDAMLALTTGKVDALVIDNEVAIDLSEKENGKTVVLDEKMTSEPYGFGFAKGSDTLVAEIDKLIKEWIADGTIEAIFDKYEVPYVAPEN